MIDKLRPTENLHILFWLVKDVCWVTDLHLPGIIMIFPTLSVAIWMCYRTRKIASELAHNIAVACWICANSIWMIGEFYYQDTTRPYAIVFFVAGLVVLAVYYIHALMRRIIR